ncbi:MAG: STAS domain-containing protein [bacterium]|nr:STAS domain-containing protein [bacterium]
MDMITTSKQGDVMVVALAGKWMSSNEAQQLAELIRGELMNGGKSIVLDLLHVTWMNSTGIGALAAVLTSVRSADAKLVLARIPSDIQELLDISHLSSVFTIRTSLEEALQAVV